MGGKVFGVVMVEVVVHNFIFSMQTRNDLCCSQKELLSVALVRIIFQGNHGTCSC